jgi:hypothetical protein
MDRRLRYVFFLFLASLVVSTLGLVGFFVIGMVFFTYQGNGMDWIYPVGGLMALLLPVSALGTIVTGTMMVIRRLSRPRRISN